MKAINLNKRVTMSALLLGLLAINTPWNQYFNSNNFVQTAELASETRRVYENRCQFPEGATESEIQRRFDAGELRELRLARTIYQQGYLRDELSMRSADDDVTNPTIYTSVGVSRQTDTVSVCPQEIGLYEDCPVDMEEQRNETLRVEVALSRNQFSSPATEGNGGLYCADCVRDEANNSFHFNVPTNISVAERIERICVEYYTRSHSAYSEMSNEILTAATREQAITEIEEKLEELENQCIAKRSADAEDVLELAGNDLDDALEALNALEGLDFSGDDTDDDLSEIGEEVMITSRGEVMACHNQNLRERRGEERDDYMVEVYLPLLRDMMLSDDSGVREQAFDRMGALVKRNSNLSRNVRHYLDIERRNASTINGYREFMDNLNRDYDTAMSRARTPEERRLVELDYQNRIDYAENVARGTINYNSRLNPLAGDSWETWSGLLDGSGSGTGIGNGTSVASLNFQMPDDYVASPGRNARQGFSLNFDNSVARAIQQQMDQNQRLYGATLSQDTSRIQVGNYISTMPQINGRPGVSRPGSGSMPPSLQTRLRNGGAIGRRN